MRLDSDVANVFFTEKALNDDALAYGQIAEQARNVALAQAQEIEAGIATAKASLASGDTQAAMAAAKDLSERIKTLSEQLPGLQAKLQDKSRTDFDRAYMKTMLSDHKKDISAFEKEAKSGKDADVKSFAADTLPTLREHLRMAEETNNTVKSSRGADPAEASNPAWLRRRHKVPVLGPVPFLSSRARRHEALKRLLAVLTSNDPF